MATKLNTLNLLALPNLVTPSSGFVSFGAKSDGLYQKVGSTERRLATINDTVASANTAAKLATSRTISLTGDASGSTSFDGSANVSISVTVADDSHNHVIANIDGLQVALDGKSPTSHTHTFASLTSKPTTLSGYGITDAVNVSEVVTTATANKILKLNSSAQLPASITGNAATATKLQTARTIALSGDVFGSASFDGSANITVSASVADDSHNHVISNVDGLQAALDGKSSTSHTHTFASLTSKPTTLSGYGITDFTSHKNSTPINPANTTVNAIGYAINVSLFGQSDGGLVNTAYSSAWQSQIFQDFRTGQVALRGKNNGTWTSWRTALDSGNYNSYAPTKTGTGASGTWGINITGNAVSAAALQTARIINGTSFNGTANITTANWGTARTISIGGTSKSVNGSANVTWATSEIAAQSAVKLATARTLWGQSFNGTANVSGNLTSVGSITMNGSISGATTISASTSINTPKHNLGNGWALVANGTETQLQYNGVAKMRFLSNGSIVAVGEITAYGATS